MVESVKGCPYIVEFTWIKLVCLQENTTTTMSALTQTKIVQNQVFDVSRPFPPPLLPVGMIDYLHANAIETARIHR